MSKPQRGELRRIDEARAADRHYPVRVEIPDGRLLIHRSAGGPQVQPSEVYSSITATDVAVLCDSQYGSAPAGGSHFIANAKPAAAHNLR